MPSSRPSGIKPPTRMVKPTSSIPRAGVSSKPAGGDGRQPSDDVTKKKISGFVDDGLSTGKDMVNFKEDSIGELPSLPEIRKNSEIRKLSDGSGSAVDAAYEMARRLSEAGVRRMSDASIILTADTDSFIVGERVYVNGIKPGSIQFIGETKFAPGDWAGIVLDDFSGKNDGSVGGVRYFQCQSKKGVFSRLNRLTREPLDSDQMALLHKKLPVQESPNEKSSENSVNVTSRHFTPPPTESTPASGSPSLVSVQSIGDLHLGDRVIVTSTQGSKTGTLRYLGNTEFAAGQWAGVELDDSLGKNDGAVAGTRYFDCQPMYGLFAPVHKVSRSPANAMSRRSSSMMNASMSSISRHGGLVRQGTRDSMGSSASIISTVSRASTAGKSTRPSASGHSQIGLQEREDDGTADADGCY